MRWRIFMLLALALPISSRAMVIRTYNPTAHQRFTGFASSAQINSNHIFSSIDMTGIGFRFGTYPTRQFALISRQHILFANHYKDQVPSGTQVRFLNASNVATTRTTGTITIIQDSGVNSDLIIVPLSTPIDAARGISPLPVLNYGTLGEYAGLPLGVTGKVATGDATTGQVPLAASGTSLGVFSESVDVNYGGSTGVLKSRLMRFDYAVAGVANDCYTTVGDSGSPTFAIVNGKAALVGVHSFVIKPVSTVEAYENYDVFVPWYANELNTVMGPSGYRVRPFFYTPTTLETNLTTIQPTPRRSMPLDWQITVSNTGAATTGNLEVEFQFDPGIAPDSINAPAGWVSYVTGNIRTFRMATMNPTDSATFTAHWDAAPSQDELTATVIRRSDTTDDSVLPMSLPLAPSFTEWSDGLQDPELDGDPDQDGIPNLLEYALGGNPENPSRLFADGSPLGPSMTNDQDLVSVTFPERADKDSRGLSYVLEFSNALAGWTDPPPEGISSQTAPYDPPVDGFVKRVITWPVDGERKFARLRVELDE